MFIKSYKPLLILIILALSSACSVIKLDRDWNEDLPQKSVFLSHYQLDQENQQLQSESSYLSWVRRFFYGTALQPSGWLKITKELVSNVADRDQALLEQTMAMLGIKIAQEWSKDNKVRKIDTKNMLVWGTALQESVENNDIIDLVTRVDEDVDALLSGELGVRDITSDRYYEMEFDEFF